MADSVSGARIGIVWYPGAQVAAVHGLEDLLNTPKRGGFGGIEAKVVRLERTLGRESDGWFTAIVVPPSMEMIGEMPAVVDWIGERHREGSLVCSVCAGAMLLAETGLLDQRPATTHWALKRVFQERYPRVQLDTQRILVDDGDIITAGGLMAWMDLGLRLIERFAGSGAMLQTARQWVVDPGGREQRFYETFAPVLNHGDEAVLRVQHWLQGKCGERVGLGDMAAKAQLGERSFLRRFQKATGMTPLNYLQVLRVERARDLLERSTLSFDEISWQLGYEDAGAFRRVFQKVMGLSPGEYRKRFRSGLGERQVSWNADSTGTWDNFAGTSANSPQEA